MQSFWGLLLKKINYIVYIESVSHYAKRAQISSKVLIYHRYDHKLFVYIAEWHV